jgi:serine/threonine-protein kinase RIO1
MKRTRVKGVASSGTGRAGSDADGVKGGAMDGRVREHLAKIVNQGWISKLNGSVKEGKEALVYHGEVGEGSGGFDVAVKVFKRIQEFRGRGNYVDGDLRYAKTPFGKIGQREQLELWTEKEFRNLVRANRSGVPVPTPLYYKDNILLMRFMGEDGWPCPQLREIDLRKGSSRWTTLYMQVMQSVKTLYQQAHLVHGDLSEYNILAVPATLVENKLVADDNELQAVLIDFGQAVEFRHSDAETLLRRDLDRINTFFVRQGVVVMAAEDAYLFCTMPEVQTE